MNYLKILLIKARLFQRLQYLWNGRTAFFRWEHLSSIKKMRNCNSGNFRRCDTSLSLTCWTLYFITIINRHLTKPKRIWVDTLGYLEILKVFVVIVYCIKFSYIPTRDNIQPLLECFIHYFITTLRIYGPQT